MNLHYSQTECFNGWKDHAVFLPYEFTLLSNLDNLQSQVSGVFLPYEFTLLSNDNFTVIFLSLSFPTIWIYTTLKRIQR